MYGWLRFIGKMVLCRVSNIARKKPQGQQLDEANPERSDDTGLWVCPFCKKDDFAEISEVGARLVYTEIHSSIIFRLIGKLLISA